uniref:Proteasome subunit beta n=1 Tax=Oryzias latipes TaxID=8090 RepID=A0A3P9LXR7_ORYLA
APGRDLAGSNSNSLANLGWNKGMHRKSNLHTDYKGKHYEQCGYDTKGKQKPSHSVSVRRPFPLSHGTTTLGFIFQGGVIAAADTRASAGGLVACPAVHKITPIHSHLVVTSSGSGADCMLWERILTREIRLYQLRHKRRLSIRGTAKLLSLMLHPFKGTDVCVALTLCGWDKLIYVCSDGARLQGDIFSVGSGSPYAYGVLDRSLSWSLHKEEAILLAREAVFRATHRDAYSGNNVDLFHVTAEGWRQRQREDLKEEYYRDMEKRGIFNRNITVWSL